MKYSEQKISEGEEFILEYLKEEGIKFKREVKIENLKGDDVEYRKADFYLKDYKIYLEFFGQWNQGEEHKTRYRQKKATYYNNKIPCIYIYPENLGILPFVLKKRISSELKKKNLKKELLRWRLVNSIKEAGEDIILFGVFLFILILCLTPPVYTNASYIFGILSTYYLLKIVYTTIKIFKN